MPDLGRVDDDVEHAEVDVGLEVAAELLEAVGQQPVAVALGAQLTIRSTTVVVHRRTHRTAAARTRRRATSARRRRRTVRPRPASPTWWQLTTLGAVPRMVRVEASRGPISTSSISTIVIPCQPAISSSSFVIGVINTPPKSQTTARIGGPCAQLARYPASTARAWPMRERRASEHSHSAAAAISSGARSGRGG